jgi:predicted nucleic acid-binding protein
MWVGDCWLLALAEAGHARLVTFDEALAEFARKQGHRAVIPH